jgi:hypothetical protein
MIPDIYKTGDYLKSNPTWHTEDSSWKSEKILTIINKNNLIPKTICEIGCGAGEILNQLHNKMSDDILFYGYEISPQAFEMCQKRKKEKLHFYLSNLLEENNVHYDILMAIDVIEHIEDYFGFLRIIKGKATYKIFHIPLDLSVQSILRSSPIIEQRKSVGHIQYFTKETAIATLVETGYEIIDSFLTAGSVELPENNLKSKLIWFPRLLLNSINQNLAQRLLGGYSLLVLAK